MVENAKKNRPLAAMSDRFAQSSGPKVYNESMSEVQMIGAGIATNSASCLTKVPTVSEKSKSHKLVLFHSFIYI